MSIFKRKKQEEQIEDIAPFFTTPDTKKPHPDALTTDEILGGFKVNEAFSEQSPLETLKKKVEKQAEPEKAEEKPFIQNDSLLDKCKPYVTEDDGTDASLDTEPLYKLQSVAEILKSESNKAIEELSKKYDLLFENLQGDTKEETPVAETDNKEAVFESENQNKVTNVQSNIPHIISDLDNSFTTAQKADELSNTATITFTPVVSDEVSKKINVSTKTAQIDLTGELVNLPKTVEEKQVDEKTLEKTEFDEYIPETEVNSPSDVSKIRRSYLLLRRNSFLATVTGFFVTAILSLGKISWLEDLFLSSPKPSMVVFTIIFSVAVAMNCNMFSSFSKFLKTDCNNDILPSLATVLTLGCAVFSIISGVVFTDLLIIMSLILSFRSLGKFYEHSTTLSNLRLFNANAQKRAIKLIGDEALTSSMAKNAIEGDTLIAATQKVEFISDYMKYSTFGKFLNGKLPLITVLSIIVSAILGVSAGIYSSSLSTGLYAATAVFIFVSLPCLFFIDTLPLYRASKKLSKLGGAIAGKTGAQQLEMANAVVLSSHDFFPKGTITLHQMKVLSENNLEDTLVRAAALTEYIGSTLTPIFKSIAKSGNITTLPDTDTVKYEERLGISGWVDNRLLFIGNRTLMETHGIEVPSVEIDRKILRSGYFPIYVATREKACALLVVQYNVDHKVARELKKLTSIGVTLLVNNSDPNISEEMLCDYFSLYSDSVKLMTSAGNYIHKNATVPIEKISSPAMCKGNPLAIPAILNCATKIKRSNTVLTVAYVIFAIFGALLFAYASFGSAKEILSQSALLVYGLVTTVVSYLIYLTERP